MATERRAALDDVIVRAEREGEAGFDCEPDGARWQLSIWGRFPPDWCGSLSLHCYGARLGVIQADARRLRSSLWAGSFTLATHDGVESPLGLDFVRMARRRPASLARPSAMEIAALRVDPGTGGASARIKLLAPDRIGLLAYVLDKLAFCGLYPHELAVRTTDAGWAEDHFHVLGAAGAPPAPHALAALESVLRPPPA